MQSYVHSCNRARTLSMLAAGSISLVLAVAMGMPAVARAAGTTPQTSPDQLFGVHPVQEGHTTLPGGHFNFALVPGQSISDGIVVENFSNHSLRFHVYGADLLTATGGGLAPAQPTAIMRGVGAWITVSVTVITVGAHSQFTDDFTVRLPMSVSSGQHLGAVVASASVGATAQGNPIEARAALIAVVTVPGVADPSAHLSPLVGSVATAGQVGFRITLSNSGNVLLTYAGLIVIDDAAGHRVSTLPLTPTNAYVVPSGQIPLAAIWNEPTPVAGMYRAQAMVTILANGIPIRTLTSQSLVLQLSSGVPAFVWIALALAIAAMIFLVAWIVRGVAGWRRTSSARRLRRTGSVA